MVSLFINKIKVHFLILSIFLSLGNAQGVDEVQFNIDNLTVSLDSSLTASFQGKIKSSSTNAVELVLMKNDFNLLNNWQVSICVDYTCFSSSIDSVFFVLLGNDSVDVIIDIIASNNISGSIELELYDIVNPTEVTLKTLTVLSSFLSVVKKKEVEKISSINFYPNPFNNIINLTFDITYNDNVDVSIYNINGSIINRMKNIKVGPGFSVINWDGKNNRGQTVNSGLYFVKLKGDLFEDILEITFLK